MKAPIIRGIDRLCGLLLVAYVVWVLVAFPWLANVYCERNAAVTLRRLTIVAEIGIFVPYTWMPVSLVMTWRAARTRPEAKILVLYGAFIVLCGLTHFLGAMAIPWADQGTTEPSRLYWLAMKLKTVTAAVSMAVARVTDQQKAKILALSNQEAELIKERDDAKAARARAETEAQAANKMRADLAVVNAELERARAAESHRAREQAARAGAAETRSEELERALVELRQKDHMLAAQGIALRTLCSPILNALEGVLVTVLVGTLDSARAADWRDRLTAQVRADRARLVIFDLTGLDVVDTQVAEAIIKTARTVRVQGCKPVLTGAQPHVASTMVSLGIDLSEFSALPTLREAIEMAMRKPL